MMGPFTFAVGAADGSVWAYNVYIMNHRLVLLQLELAYFVIYEIKNE
jgi:hypothetical protein